MGTITDATNQSFISGLLLFSPIVILAKYMNGITLNTIKNEEIKNIEI